MLENKKIHPQSISISMGSVVDSQLAIADKNLIQLQKKIDQSHSENTKKDRPQENSDNSDILSVLKLVVKFFQIVKIISSKAISIFIRTNILIKNIFLWLRYVKNLLGFK